MASRRGTGIVVIVGLLLLLVVGVLGAAGKRLHPTLGQSQVQEFTCGDLFYRTLYLDASKDVLYVGAMDHIFRLNLANINTTNCKTDVLHLEASNVHNCVSKGKSVNYDCKNHIRVIQPMGDGSRLYVCGTNAHGPKDWVIYANLTHLPKNEVVPGIFDGTAKCPFDPDDNSTAVWVEKGNPGGLPALYSGTVAEFTKADTVIFRMDLYNHTSGQRAYNFKRTIKYDSKWLDKPNFVGSYEIGEYVFFFFRETAVEYINCGKNVYSRIARVCKMDTGGKNILHQNWATFLKARLNCSIPGEFPFYFNEIQSVYKMPDNDTRFYAVFTTSMNGLMGSAICTFDINDIQETFGGKFKEQASSSSAWLPVLSSKVPEPRPGQCVNDTQTLPDTVLNFIRGHPLMDSAVPHMNNKPVYFKRDLIFTHLVVDRIGNYTIYYAGAYDGKVYKIVEWYDRMGESHSNLLDALEVLTPEPVRALQISSKHKSLYVVSDTRIRQVELAMCTARYSTCMQCVQDPYCGWDAEHVKCRPYRPDLLQDVTNASSRLCDNCVKNKLMHVHWGQTIHLGCAIAMPATLNSVPVQWFHARTREKGDLVNYRPEKYVETAEYGLIILSLSENDSGRYDCRMGPTTLCSYNITVNTKTCSAPDELQYRKIYSDWCKEFEKYKNLMQKWETKQLSCQRQTNQNLHPNDVTIQKSPFV